MEKITFNGKRHLAIGVEVEVQLLDKKSLNLTPQAIKILNLLGDCKKVQPELFQSMLEVTSGVCWDVHQVKMDIKNTLLVFDQVCSRLHLKYATTGTHPFAEYNERKVFPASRYQYTMNRKQWIAKRLCVFGLHVHLGMQAKEECIEFMNMFQWFLPYFIALSTSSPFWQAKDTGLHSSRLTVFEASPTSGHCPHLSNWAEFERQLFLLTYCKSIRSPKDIWWDIRPSVHGTIEIRVCDGVATLHKMLGIVSLVHAIAHYYNKYRNFKSNNCLFDFNDPYPLWLIRENKWRAMRYGINMKVITTGGENIPFKKAIKELLKVLQPTIDKLEYNEYIEYINQILTYGTSAERQLSYYAQCKDFKKVVAFNAYECKESFINDVNFIRPNKYCYSTES